MNAIRVIVTGPEEAYDNEAELWCARELFAVTVLHDGRLHLRIDPRTDGAPWLADVAGLARALTEAQERLAAFCLKPANPRTPRTIAGATRIRCSAARRVASSISCARSMTRVAISAHE